MRLEGKNIIVTGSTTGIGRAMARRFVREGARVLIHGTNRARGEAMLQELGEAAALHLDPLDDPSSPARIVAAALAAFGSLHAVVNNAASVPKSVLESVTVESFEQTMAVNTLAPLLLTQAALPALKQTQGCILNIGSVNAYCGEPGLLVYSMTKGAMQTMTRNLGDTLHREYLVRVNQINPGWVITDNELERKQEHGVRPGWEKRVPKMFAPSGSIIDPEVIASAAVYFLGDESRPVSGSVVELEQYPMIGRNPPKAEE